MDSVIDADLERGLFVTPAKQSQTSNLLDLSTSSSTSSTSASAMVRSAGKQIDQAGKKKYVKQVTGRHNDTELHLAAQRGDMASVKHILDEMVGTVSEVAEIRASVVNEVNELRETALYTAAEKGHLEVVKELLKYSDKDTLRRRSLLEFDALHIAASQGHHAIVKLLLDHDVSLCQTYSKGNATPLITAALKGHTAVVQEILSKDPSLLDISRNDGKNALHLAARSGHVETVKSLLAKDPQMARITDKKGQTALHMAVKGASSEVVKLLLEADAAIVMLPDKSGFTALHVATRKKRAETVNELLRLPDTNVNALTRDHKTALDIAERLPLSPELGDIRDCLLRCGAVRAIEWNQPELKNTVAQIKSDVHEIAKELRKLQRKGTNSVNVAVLFSAVTFAAIFTVPGGDNDDGMAVVAHNTCFKIFFIFNAVALYTSLAVVVVHMTLGVSDAPEFERVALVIINKLMWLASVSTSVAFISSSYIVVGRKYEWIAVCITVLGVFIMTGVIGTMMYIRRFSKRLVKQE